MKALQWVKICEVVLKVIFITKGFPSPLPMKDVESWMKVLVAL